MKNILNKYLTGAGIMALTFSLTSNIANAACTAMPTCAQLGYNKTSCGSGDYIKCPFDKTKLKCISDPCKEYHDYHEAEGCYPGVGDVVTNSACPNSCKMTRCYKYFYDDPNSGETGLVLQDGKCVEAGAGNCGDDAFYLNEIPNFVKQDPFIDLSNTCGDMVIPSCKFGTYWYGKCDFGGVDVGSLFPDATNPWGVVSSNSNGYINIIAINPIDDNNYEFLNQSCPGVCPSRSNYAKDNPQSDSNGYQNTEDLKAGIDAGTGHVGDWGACSSSLNKLKMFKLSDLVGSSYGALDDYAEVYIPAFAELMSVKTRMQSLGATNCLTSNSIECMTSTIFMTSSYPSANVKGGQLYIQWGGKLHPAIRLNANATSGSSTVGGNVGTILKLDGVNIGYILEDKGGYTKIAALTDFNGTYFGNCASSGGYSCDISGPALSDFNGYENTENILATYTSCTSDSCAFYKATHYTPNGVGSEYNALVSSGKIHWYVPALGELMMLENFFFSTEAVNANYYSSCNDSSYYMTSTGQNVITARTSSSSCYDTRTFENTQYYAGKIIPFAIISK